MNSSPQSPLSAEFPHLRKYKNFRHSKSPAPKSRSPPAGIAVPGIGELTVHGPATYNCPFTVTFPLKLPSRRGNPVAARIVQNVDPLSVSPLSPLTATPLATYKASCAAPTRYSPSRPPPPPQPVHVPVTVKFPLIVTGTLNVFAEEVSRSL